LPDCSAWSFYATLPFLSFGREIASILEKHGTEYAVILMPTYDQQKLDLKDFIILQKKHLKKNLHNISEKKKYNEDFYYYP
jgi:hypothetical protein